MDLEHLKALRAYYPKTGNKAGKLLDGLIKDHPKGKMSAATKKLIDDTELDPTSTAYKAVERTKVHLK